MQKLELHFKKRMLKCSLNFGFLNFIYLGFTLNYVRGVQSGQWNKINWGKLDHDT